GTDANLFTISSAGVLSFVAAPDYEDAQDNGTNNVYDLIITIEDASGNETATTVTVTVTNQVEAEVIINITDSVLLENENPGAEYNGSFNIVLGFMPTADVTIPLISSDTSEGTVVANVIFTPLNWNVVQEIEVVMVDDLIGDGSVEFTIETGAPITTDSDYDSLVGSDIINLVMTTQNNDPPGIIGRIVGNAIAETSESGSSLEIEFELLSEPLDDTEVTIPLTIDDSSEGSVNVTSITISSDNWNQPINNRVVVSAVDDSDLDGDVIYKLITGDPTSSDPNYDLLSGGDVIDFIIINKDDELDTDNDEIPDNIDTDDDNDGTPDSDDDFPLDDTEDTDTDGDNIGDNADTDDDNDGTPDVDDDFPLDDTEDTDTDGDNIGDNADTDDDNDGTPDVDDDFPLDDTEDTDTDGDNIGDNADTDDDGDGTLDVDDDFPLDDTEDTDTDGDTIGDNADTDDDGDGTPDADDDFPLDDTEDTDTDGDNIGDNEDTDDDGDGQSDADEVTCGSDPLDAASMSLDTDADGIPDCIDTDDDNDGTPDADDDFPLDDTEDTDTDGDTIGDNADTDDDNDGTPDADDDFPLDDTEVTDTDGDTIGDNADTDDDNDGILDTDDDFPLDDTEDTDKDGDNIGDNADTDDDNDGTLDVDDDFPLDDTEDTDTDGDNIGDNADTDDDNDGTPDADDDFPLDDTEDTDTDGDNIGDNADTDDDNDGTPDADDDFPLDDTEDTDTDGDNIGDNADTDDDNDGTPDVDDDFPLDDTEDTDTDGDNIGDNADIDDDNDGTPDADDDFPLDDTEDTDTDGDNIGDNADTDDDNDGTPDVDDDFPLDDTEDTDTDGDNIGDNEDTDDDGDGTLDVDDDFPLDDTEDTDTDGDNIGDNEDTDDDGDGQSDADEVACGSDPLDADSLSLDTDGDGVPNCLDTDSIILNVTQSLTNSTSCAGSNSSEQIFTVSGLNLIEDIIVTAPSNWELSTTSGSGFTSSVTLLQTNGLVTSTPIYIRTKSNTVSGNLSGNVTISSTGATPKIISVTGFVKPSPNSPIIDSNGSQLICVGETIANLNATTIIGNTVEWFTTPTGGNALASSTVLVPGTTYYAQTKNSIGCSSTRVSLTAVTNNALHFDGVNDYVLVGDVIENLNDITSQAWVYWEGSFISFSEIYTKDYISSMAITSANKLHANFGNGTTWVGAGINSTTSIPLNQWTHVTVTRKNGVVKMYINGEEDTSSHTNNATGSNNAPRIIGGKALFNSNSTANTLFHGIIDEVRFWDVAKTQAEIQDEMSRKLEGTETGLLAYYNFNQGIINADNTSITTLKDKTLNPNIGTLNNLSLTGITSNWVQGYFPQITGFNNVNIGQTINLSNVIQSGIWSVNDTDIATISQTGVLTGITEGTVTVTYTSCNNSTTKQILVTNLNTAPIITSISDTNSCPNTNLEITTPIIDLETSAANLLVTASSSNQNIVANNEIAISHIGNNFTFRITPVIGMQGTTSIIINAEDEYGAIESISFEVAFTDTENPIITNTPVAINQNNDLGVNGAIVIWTLPTAADNCAIDTFESSYNSGDLFPIGTTTVIYTATDINGNETTSSFEVTINDIENPIISDTPSDITQNNDEGLCGAVITWTAPTVSDNASIASYVSSHNSGDLFPVGSTTVTYTATDNYGNETISSFEVTVIDVEKPVVVSQPIITVIDFASNANQCGAIVFWNEPEFTDNCSIASIVQTHESGDLFLEGDTTVSYTITDVSGNETTVSIVVTIEASMLDCDGDGVSNAQEEIDNTDAQDSCSSVPSSITMALSQDFLDSDCDGDGLTNGEEIGEYATDPNDSNNNDIYDYLEFNNQQPSEDELEIFNLLTPNGDGKNDVFVIRNIELYPENTLEIYNRWGVKVYDVSGYGQNGRYFIGQSGGRVTINGNSSLPSGTYFYVLKYRSSGVWKNRTGYLNLTK
uniref:HYR domain-containing protein n=1 Tax=uncultured Polaribacter sp. TaxID=174711 RepID=UPI0026374AF9